MFPIFFLLKGSCITYGYYIVYDFSQKRFILKKEKIFKCFKKDQIIQINDIKKVIFKKYRDADGYNCFKVNFILTNEKKIIALNISEERVEYKSFSKFKNNSSRRNLF